MTDPAIRTLRRAEREHVLALLDEWPLSDRWRGRDFFRRYVEHDPVYTDEDFWVAEQAGRLLACVQIFPRLLRLRSAAVPTGGIGSVFTSEKARGSGVSSRLLEAAVAAMRARGMELSLLFAARHAFYARLGWSLWPRPRELWIRGAATPAANRDVAAFDAGRDLDAVAALHERYCAALDGTVVRNRAFWRGQLSFAGNPGEDFSVARDGAGRIVAYARGCLLEGIYCLSELGRSDASDAADALADLVLQTMQPRDPDPIAGHGGRQSAELRRVLLAPPVADAALDAALAARAVERKAFEERATMLRIVDAQSLARRVGEAPRAGESDAAYLARLLPPERFAFWPADRF